MEIADFSTTIRDFVWEMYGLIARHKALSAICLFGMIMVSMAYAVLRPAQFVASMIITPIETSAGDATTQLLSSGISLRPQLSLTNGPPPAMSAFLKILKSPEMARYLAADAKAADAILDGHKGILGQIKEMMGIPADDSISGIQHWLETNVTVDQDVDLMAWTINLRHGNAQSAVYILSALERDGEEILRRSAIKQYDAQHRYVLGQINLETDANVKATLYTILASIERSRVVLRSGSNFATAVISEPFVPSVKSYPPRLISFAVAFTFFSLITILVIAKMSYARLRRLHREKSIGEEVERHGKPSAAAPSYSH